MPETSGHGRQANQQNQVGDFRKLSLNAGQPDDSGGMRAIFAGMPASLKRLLAADCLVRIGEGIATSFIVLFVTHTRHFSVVEYGALYAVQQQSYHNPFLI